MSFAAPARSRWVSRAILALPCLVALLISLFLLSRLDPIFYLIALVWFAACVLNIGLCKGSTARLIWVNFGFFCLFMGATELYFRFQIPEVSVRSPVTREGTTANLYRRDDRLGYALNADVTVTNNLDVDNGNTSSITALNAVGGDGGGMASPCAKPSTRAGATAGGISGCPTGTCIRIPNGWP